MNKFAFHSLSYLIEAPYYFLPVLLNHYDKSPHDLSTLRVAGEKIFWKIDYYDPLYQFGSEDPNDPAKTGRLLTILLAEEY